jgi:asparagine synthase (glutamine-hydrolysing)
LKHRGPDFGDFWVSDDGVALAHRRLSILDLSASGRQPMTSANGRYVIVFNGEVYNHSILRASIESEGMMSQWRGRSDTETILESISAWGLKNTLAKLRGMFALGLWDQLEKSLTLVRDRIGEKPIYYGYLGNCFAFASELKALRALPGWQPEVDPAAVSAVLRYGYVPSPLSIYRGIFKLPPGSLVKVTSDGCFDEPESWWDFRNVAHNGSNNPLLCDDINAVSRLGELLGNAVDDQMVADVPIGALLSGGIDSSLVVASMQAKSNRPVKTFTIGFANSEYNEASYALAVARYLGTEHTELYVTSEDASAVIPRLPEIYDEPFADASQIPTALVCELTSKHVKVCLSGDGGDELFGGYNRYLWAPSLWNRIGSIPVALRQQFARAIMDCPVGIYNYLLSRRLSLLPRGMHLNNPGDKMHKLADVCGATTPDALYQGLVSQWRGKLPMWNAVDPPVLLGDPNQWPQMRTFAERMMAVDTLTYLPDDILVKVDRASMAASLETRVPFLDVRMIEFAWSLPLHMKIRDGRSKWIMRQLMARYLPEKLFERPKQGFAVPIDDWLRGPLREWAEDLLSPSALGTDGMLNPKPIREMWTKHLSGRNVQYALWGVLMYQAWKRRWMT